VLSTADGSAAVQRVRSERTDVIILDGIEVCWQLRGFSDAYVLMLAARTEELDKLMDCR
jgi:DNA-binding response OmpR family regulator